jgi:hypothetical protein
MQVNRNGDILRHIVRYCGEIDETVTRFGANRDENEQQ